MGKKHGVARTVTSAKILEVTNDKQLEKSMVTKKELKPPMSTNHNNNSNLECVKLKRGKHCFRFNVERGPLG